MKQHSYRNRNCCTYVPFIKKFFLNEFLKENQQTPKAERPDRDASNVSYEGSPLKLQVFATDNTMTTTASGKLIKALNAKEARWVTSIDGLMHWMMS